MRSLDWLIGFRKGGGEGEGIMTAGKRSRSGSEFSELAKRVVEDKEGREPGVMKRGLGGVREVSSSAEAEGSDRYEPSSLTTGLLCPRSLDIRWRSRPLR